MRTVRAAAHVHSEWSDDATWRLSDIATAFADRGYDVVLLADHCREFVASRWAEYRAACAEASGDSILLVPGIEYNDLDNAVHVPVWGDVPFYGQEVPDIGVLLARVAADGGTSVLAHPWRRDAWRRYQPGWSAHLAAVEVWNRKYDGIAPNPHAAELARREGLRHFTAVDFHTSRQFFPLAMRLRLASDTVDLPAVHRALREGAFTPVFRDRPVESMLRGPALRAAVAAETARRAVRPVVNRLRRLRG
ncbi:PHP domain-containing protein [Micromonospora sp. CPCC 206061]|uniref:PHP domain-containing protein n=1 Tax=Micromonospora sp. CPCC 206061 TaxID=3122410 RepID=UPI002FF15EB6